MFLHGFTQSEFAAIFTGEDWLEQPNETVVANSADSAVCDHFSVNQSVSPTPAAETRLPLSLPRPPLCHFKSPLCLISYTSLPSTYCSSYSTTPPFPSSLKREVEWPES